jgi:hypothetical protein
MTTLDDIPGLRGEKEDRAKALVDVTRSGVSGTMPMRREANRDGTVSGAARQTI